jgi:hypothetical protein
LRLEIEQCRLEIEGVSCSVSFNALKCKCTVLAILNTNGKAVAETAVTGFVFWNKFKVVLIFSFLNYGGFF